MSDEVTFAEDPVEYYRALAVQGVTAGYLIENRYEETYPQGRFYCWLALWNAVEKLPVEMQRMFFDERLHVSIKTEAPAEGQTDGKFSFVFWVNCNDLFWWACSDGEAITPADYPGLLQALKESPEYGGQLWCARQRGWRPQGPYYKYFSFEERGLFNAVGPERIARDVRIPQGTALPYTPPFELRD